MEYIPNLTNKDIRRTRNGLALYVPNGDGSHQVLQVKEQSRSAGLKLLDLGNKQINSINHSVKIHLAWLDLAGFVGLDNFIVSNHYSERKTWLNHKPITNDNELIRVLSSIHNYYSDQANELELSALLSLGKKPRNLVLHFLKLL